MTCTFTDGSTWDGGADGSNQGGTEIGDGEEKGGDGVAGNLSSFYAIGHDRTADANT